MSATVDLAALPPVLRVEEAARVLRIGRGTAYDLIRRDEFPVPVLRFGRRVVVPRRALLELLGETPSQAADEGEARAP